MSQQARYRSGPLSDDVEPEPLLSSMPKNKVNHGSRTLSVAGALMTRVLGRLLAPPGKNNRFTILTYHRVLSGPDPLRSDEYDAASFAWQMRLLTTHFTVLSLNGAIEALWSGRLPPRAVCVTFDDGYLDNVENALPILLENNIQATFFISTAFLDGGCMWNDTVIEAIRLAPGPVLDLDDYGLDRYSLATREDRARTVRNLLRAIKYLDSGQRMRVVEQIHARAGADMPRGIMMRPEHIRQLSRVGMEVGGHTMRHPILTRIGDADAATEIADGKRALEEILGHPVRYFAYPNGVPHRDYDRRHVQMVKDIGFNAAVTTSSGSVTGSSDLFQLPRFAPWDREPTRFALRLLQNYRRAGEIA